MAQWTHIIQGLTADELEANENGNASSANGSPIGSPRTTLVEFEPRQGCYWAIISIYCKADGSDTIPKIRPYFEDTYQASLLAKLEVDPATFFAKGELIYRKDSAGNEVKTTDGSTEKYILAPVYIGNYKTRFALEACQLGADLVITIDRVALEQIPS